METQELIQQVSKQLAMGDLEGVIEILKREHPSQIADAFIALEPSERLFLLNSIDPEIASQVLLEFDTELRQDILKYIAPDTLSTLTGVMDSDDAADIISELPQNKASIVLSGLSPKEAKEVETLLQYPEDTAGGIMQTELVQTLSTHSVRDTINLARRMAEEVDDFHVIYVTDEQSMLLGVLPLNKLIMAGPGTLVGSIMEPIVATVTPFQDQEEAANVVTKYDLVSLPVVDDRGVLIGRITADDVIDVITEEASEDILHLAGVGDRTHPIYTPTITRMRSRMPWILLGLFGELLLALMISRYFKPTLEKVIILAAFMPVIMATGGNVGIQATTIVIRALGMGTINLGQAFRVLISELKLGLAIGLISGLVAAGCGILISMQEPQVMRLSIAIFTAMVFAIVTTTAIGVLVPFILQRWSFDPAVASSPFVTMSNDIIGSGIYLFIAMLLF